MQPDEGIVQSITKVVGLLSRRLHQILIWTYFQKPAIGNGERVFYAYFMIAAALSKPQFLPEWYPPLPRVHRDKIN